MARNEKELTEAEKRRLVYFNQLCEKLLEQGYHKTDLTSSVVTANTKGVLYGLLLSFPFVIIYVLFLTSSDFTTQA